MNLENGTIINQYKIVSAIGKGGMGEVYLAQDTKLDRKVAIKFLNEQFSKDADKLNRFVQEAKAASALNHPNILTIHEIGEVDGKNYIVTELIDGNTLRAHLAHKESLQLNVILKIGVQVSEALAAAHQAGIVHRDIKPENIMLRKDGYAKVLDFGLAKLTEKKTTDEVSTEGETRVFVKTTPGMVMGTVSYMSPEQARGTEIDARTDIWSLGVVLYEMLAAKVPFTGETVNHTIVSILEKEPLLLDDVPAELQRIVRKSLTKDVEMRYQTAHDLLIDLKNLRRDLDIQGELERSIIPNRETASASLESATQVHTTDPVATTRSGQTSATQNISTSSSSLEYAVTQAKGHKLVSAIVGTVLLAIITTVTYFAFVYKGGTQQINSIAVMPFANDSGNADLEYLADGMTESLISSLSGIPDLSVKARSSVFRYKGKDFDSARIGSELKVQALLVGRLIPKGYDLSLRLELVDAATETVLWSDSFDKKIDDLVALQKEIAQDVSKKLRMSLSPVDRDRLAKTYTENSEAHRVYLQGRFHWEKRNLKDFEKAMSYFEQAIEKDPEYAMAYAGLADTYQLIPVYDDGADPRKYMPLAKEAALKAIELDPQLAEAHASLGRILFTYFWDFPGAERSLKRALEIKPDYATAHLWYAEYLGIMNRPEEDLTEVRKALGIEPFSLVINRMVAAALTETGKIDQAMTQYKKTIELFPNDATTKLDLAYFQASQKEYTEAVKNALEGNRLTGMEAEWLERMRGAAEKDGWVGYRRVIAEYGEEQKRRSGHYSGYSMAGN
jgi:eukaryotic-like serine/threonine-protein kinase